MKKKLCLLVMLCWLLMPNSADASPYHQWDALMDAAHQFTWYPRENLLDLFEKYTLETGVGLAGYAEAKIQVLAASRTPESATVLSERSRGIIESHDLAADRPWREYYRLAMGQFCLFIAGGNHVHLANARTVMTFLIEKTALPEIAFWDLMFLAHTNLIRHNRDGFMEAVFTIWRNIVLKQEAVSMLAETSFPADISYLYENLAALIIRQGVIDYQLPDLHPLSVVILDIRRKLSLGAGYKRFVEAVAERMTGLKSDNYNLNFAVFFVEAVSNHHSFEKAESRRDLEAAWEKTLNYQALAEKSVKTGKGRAALLTFKMSFIHYALQRMADGDQEMIASDKFDTLPDMAWWSTQQASVLYDTLAGAAIIKPERFSTQGFSSKTDYIKAMHQLWDACAKLQFSLSAYHNKLQYRNIQLKAELVERPLTQYLSLFEKYASVDREIVPDNAFFMAAYAAGELAHLYREISSQSTSIFINDFALARQLQAIEIYPADVSGCLQLANQSLMENRLNFYMKYAYKVASRLRGLNEQQPDTADTVIQRLKFEHITGFPELPVMITIVLPDFIDLAPMIVPYLKQQEAIYSLRAGDPLIRKALVMSELLKQIQHKRTPAISEGILSAISGREFTGPVERTHIILRDILPEDMYKAAESIAAYDYALTIAKLNYTLYGALEHEVHKLLRTMFYAVPYHQRIYPHLLQERPLFGIKTP